jgi:carbonic anhydrase
MGHSRCGAVTEAVRRFGDPQLAQTPLSANLAPIVADLQNVIDAELGERVRRGPPGDQPTLVDIVAQRNVLHVVRSIREQSPLLKDLEEQGRIAVVGGFYDVATGCVDFFDVQGRPLAIVPRGDSPASPD